MRAKEERNAFFPPFSSSPPSHPIYYAHTVVAFGSKMKFRDFCNFNARAPDDQDDFSNVRFFTYARDSFVQSSSNFFRRARYIFLFFFYSSETMHEHQWDERRVILILWKFRRGIMSKFVTSCINTCEYFLTSLLTGLGEGSV